MSPNVNESMSSTAEFVKGIKSRLPSVTQRLVNTLGWEGALTFQCNHGKEGGRCVYIPVEYNPDSTVFSAMNEEQANALIKAFGGQDMELGGPKRMLASERYQLVYYDYKNRNFTVKMLSEKYKLPTRTVRWILRDFKD